MNKSFKIVTLSVIALLLMTCGNDDEIDCSLILPEPNWFEIGFFDLQGQPLIGTVYTQSEFRIFNDNSETFLTSVPTGDPTRLQIFYDFFESDIDYYIELSAVDTDTLRFIYQSTLKPCSIDYDLESVIYNGESVTPVNPRLVNLIK